jgi:hypothetical protein
MEGGDPPVGLIRVGGFTAFEKKLAGGYGGNPPSSNLSGGPGFRVPAGTFRISHPGQRLHGSGTFKVFAYRQAGVVIRVDFTVLLAGIAVFVAILRVRRCRQVLLRREIDDKIVRSGKDACSNR